MSAAGLGLREGTLALAAPDPRWAAAFAALADRLRPALPPTTAIHHIGSTAVPGLTAKPILDAVIVSPDRPAASAALEGAGFPYSHDRSGWLHVGRAAGARTHNLHLHLPDDPEWPLQIAFRDRLRADPALRDAYAAEKARIVAAGTPRGGYAEAKSAFIRAALA
ncbi:GrpB family protein [Jannaschia sp. Os4]|uniref:GrpB family protein n=1 Tax=Jannaschia sp. Os4 TaxID=2807617 RepID=UPI00193A1F1F|nr:GrpB family protein [Jannaschia sp. Os4]MBM2577776.1 GrpB family protein [Jannaschia sp. Os4]